MSCKMIGSIVVTLPKRTSGMYRAQTTWAQALLSVFLSAPSLLGHSSHRCRHGSTVEETDNNHSMCLHRQLTNHVQPAKYKCNTWADLCNILCEVEYFNTHHSSRTFLTLTFPTKPWACWYCYNSVTRCKENGYKSDFYMELITFKSAMQP